MPTKQLYRHKEENNFEAFYESISSFTPNLKKFIVRSLKAAEAESLIDRGFYDAEGILDEIFMEIYRDFDQQVDEARLRALLFAKGVKKIEEKKVLEQETPEYLATEQLLKQELDALGENFTAQADGDLILNTELDDISYKQQNKRPLHVILDEELEAQLMKKLDMTDVLLPSLERKIIFGALYKYIPRRSKTILELYAFGNRSVQDISEILEVPEDIVDHIIKNLKERFRLL